jgi:putative flippase GtrA
MSPVNSSQRPVDPPRIGSSGELGSVSEGSDPEGQGRFPGMPPLVQRIIDFLRTAQGRTMIKFSCVSAISTVVAQGTLWIVYYDYRLWSAVVCNIFANACATLPSYTLNRRWAWGKSGKSHLWREVVPFWALSAIGMAISIGTVSIAAHEAKIHHLGHLSTSILVNFANLFAFGVLWIVKFFVFSKLFKTADGEKLGPVLLEV